MRAILALAAAAALTAAAARPSWGSEEWSFEAFQPIWNLGGTIALSRDTVLTYNSTAVGICAVLATCDSSLVMTDYGPQQRNAAFDVGLRAEVLFNSDREPPLFGDTLRVVLSATRPPKGIEDSDFGFQTVVAATVQCILANAAQSAAIKVVDLRTTGAATLQRQEGVFSTAPYQRGPEQREFR